MESAPRAANVIANEKVRVLYINKDNFEQVFGSLATMIKKDAETRELNSPTRIPDGLMFPSPPISPIPSSQPVEADYTLEWDEEEESLIENVGQDEKKELVQENKIVGGSEVKGVESDKLKQVELQPIEIPHSDESTMHNNYSADMVSFYLPFYLKYHDKFFS